MINFNGYGEDDYYLYPFTGNIEFAKKRKPMAAAVKKKISQSLKGKRRRKGSRKNAKRAAIAGAALGAAGLIAGGRKLAKHNQNKKAKEEFRKLLGDVHAASYYADRAIDFDNMGKPTRAAEDRLTAKEIWSDIIPKNITHRD